MILGAFSIRAFNLSSELRLFSQERSTFVQVAEVCELLVEARRLLTDEFEIGALPLRVIKHSLKNINMYM